MSYKHLIRIVYFSGYFINHKQIENELGIIGASEKEILCTGFERWGKNLFLKLNGLFSFVIYDEEKNQWICCRDRFGGKGLYYTIQNDGTPIFAGTIKELLKLKTHFPVFREEILEIYLSYSYIPDEKTLFEEIYKPLPGYYYCFEKGNVFKERYFTPCFQNEERTEEEWVDLISNTLDMIFDEKKKGGTALLSSGIDSSYICKRIIADDVYTVDYDDADYSEANIAKNFSQKIGARFHSLKITPEDYLSSLNETMKVLEQPTGDATSVVLYMICQKIKKDNRFCYSGEGIDEMFFGYYMNGVRSIPTEKTLCEAEYIGSTYALSEKIKKCILRNYKTTNKMAYVKEAYELSKNNDRLHQAAMIDLIVGMNGNLLPNIYSINGDLNLQLITPYLDNRLYDLALKIPSFLQNDEFLTKKIFRKVVNCILGSKIAMQPKRGFPVPIRLWIRRPDYVYKIKQRFTSDTAFRFFKREELIKLYDEMLSNPNDMESWRMIWCIYCFIIWYDEMINQYKSVQRWLVYDDRFNKEEMWRKENYPGCKWHYMKQSGCLVISLATLLVMNGLESNDENIFNPIIFCEKLKKSGLFDKNADLLLDKINEVCSLQYFEEVPWDIKLLNEAMKDGFLCLLCVPGVHDAYHFVVPTEIVGNDVRIIDSGWDYEYLSEFSCCYSILIFKKKGIDITKTWIDIR